MTPARAWALSLLALLLVARPLSAQQSFTNEPTLPVELSLDFLSPLRIGWGHSQLFDAPVLSLSFEDHLFWPVSDQAMLGLVFGMDAQRARDDLPGNRAFLATGIGPSLLLGSGRGSPALVMSAVPAPLWQTHDDESSLSGFGIAGRAELWPFHQAIEEAITCRHGALRTYVLSGINFWGLARYDWLGARGESWAAGFGIDLGRNLLLPILGAALNASCAQPP